ncbi:MAG: ABC transporter permease [Lachnospiraceae bacterium]|nr:ABC transporter permease [Lachnospiraceae bacterium]
MTKNLRHKLIRDLKANLIQFLAIFVMCFLAMFILETFDSDLTGTSNSINEYFQDTNFMDLQMSSEGFTSEDLITVLSVAGVKDAERRATFVGRTRIGGAEKKIEFNFIDKNNVSRMMLMDGEPYESGMSGLWIDRHFARRQGIEVGDSLQLTLDGTEFSEQVRGIVDQPDHLYFMVDDTYTEPDFGAYGFAFLDSGDYPGDTLVYDRIFIDLDTVDNQIFLDEKDEAEIEAAKKRIQEVITKTSLSFTPKQKEPGFNSVSVDMESDETLSTVFPALFALIALLGIMTTMTRLVMKQRTIIGTLKALGFSGPVVMVHFVSYSVVVSLAGGITGALAGWWTMGKYIHGLMNMYYSNPYDRMEVSSTAVVMMLIIAVMAGGTNYLSCRKLLVQRASDILRPEPPVVMGAGALEKTPLWKKLGFATRWNLRDINRNRMRTVGGLLGVSLCTMLLFTAFGANELIKANESWEYDELTPAGYTVGFAEGTGYGGVYDYAMQYKGQMVENREAELTFGDMSKLYNVSIADEGNLYHFENADGEYVKLPDYGIAMSHKAAELMGVKKDDIIRFSFSGEPAVYSARVNLIYKSPVVQGIAMSRKYLESLGAEFRPNVLYTDMTVPASYVVDREEVTSVFSKEAYIKSLRARKASMDTTVTYIMVIAVVIGVVVMYNLGIMSFTEKTREIATLKVLGFPTKKIRWILQQQNIIITGIGTVIGLIAGSKTLVFMMVQIDVDSDFMFAKMSMVPAIIAFLVSFVLSIAVNEIISLKVKDINMVEALKGVE